MLKFASAQFLDGAVLRVHRANIIEILHCSSIIGKERHRISSIYTYISTNIYKYRVTFIRNESNGHGAMSRYSWILLHCSYMHQAVRLNLVHTRLVVAMYSMGTQ